MNEHARQPTEQQTDTQERLRTSALFLMGTVSILFFGVLRSFVALFLPVRVPAESSQLALLRLQYIVFGVTIFSVYACCYRFFDRCEQRPQRLRARLGFWLMFVGFNLAFLPMSWRGATRALITEPAVLISGSAGTMPLVGGLMFIAGALICLWNLTGAARHGGRGEYSRHDL